MINSISDEDDPEYFPYEVFDLSRFDPMLASTVESLYSETSVWKLCLFYYDFDCNIFILFYIFYSFQNQFSSISLLSSNGI